MEKAWLASQLDAGRSFEATGREVGRHPSTVSYWANKHGLASTLASKHAPRGGIDRDELAALVAEGLTVEAIAQRRGVGATTVRHWLAKHGLRTIRARRPAEPREPTYRSCARHGWTLFVPTAARQLRRRRCRVDHVTRRRRKVKATLVAEAGGHCRLCGYERYAGALQFHHVDPTQKAFSISIDGVARSLARARAEASKCVLLCANCHTEVEAGIAKITNVA